MPDYKVTTDQGAFKVTLDREPDSPEQLNELVSLHMTSQGLDKAQARMKTETDAARNRLAKPPIPSQDESRPRDFMGHLQSELKGAGEDISAAGRSITPGNKEQSSFIDPLRGPLGLLRGAAAPVTAAARGVADLAGGNITEALAPKIGSTPAALIGTAVGTPIEFVLSGGAGALRAAGVPLAKLFPKGIAGTTASVGEKTAKGLVKRLPGSQVAQMEAAIDTTREALGGKTAAATARAGGLQQAVDAIPQNEAAQLAKTVQSLDDIIAGEMTHGIQDKTLLRDAKRLKQVIEDAGGAPSLQWIDKELSRIGEKTKAVIGANTNPAYKRLFGSMANDLESTPSGLGKTIRDRDKGLREQYGWEDLTGEFNNLVKLKKGMEGVEDVNTAQLLNKLKRKDFLMDSLNPDDWKDVEAIFKKVAEMPALPPPKGVMAGSYRALTTGGGGAALAAALGADPATAGIVGGGLMALERASMMLLPNRIGRKLVRGVLEAGPINKDGIDMLTAAANSMGSGENELQRMFKKKAANQ